MKAQILKLAGVKTEKEFYKKYPTEEAFMKKYGKQLKKADPGAAIGLTKPKQMDVNIATPTLTAIDPIVSKVGKSKSFFGGINDSLNNMSKADVKGLASGVASGLSGIIGGFDQLNEEKKQIGNLNMWGNVSNVVAAAAGSRPQAAKRRYARPEDQMVENMNPLGVAGDNFLQAANGTMIGGNPTEIQNTYAPNVMYTDLGYEPLNDSNKVKNFKKGGKLKKAKSGVAQILGGVGSAASAIPGIGTIASVALPLLGDVYDLIVPDKNAQEIKKKEEEIAMNTGFAQGQNQVANTFGQYSESGSVGRNGWVSHDWQPQVITKFGDLDVSQVHAFAHDGMPEYRAGGHLKEYTPPSAEAMYTGRADYGTQMAMGGDLQVHRGKAETISHNPYLPNGGETVMFKGPSHDNGGMPISFGQNGVEVEGGEPAQIMKDGGKKDSLVVYGNMIADAAAAAHIGDPKAKDRKYKNLIADYAKVETKANKTIEKATMLANNPDASPLELSTAKAMMKGGDLTLAKIADHKVKAAEWQNAILDISDKYKLKSDEFAKGKFVQDKEAMKKAMFGAKMETAKDGKNVKYDPEFENFINQAMMLEQANSATALKQSDGRMLGGVYRGGAGNYGTGEAKYNTPEKAKDFYYKNYWSKVKDLPAGLRTRALQMAINTGDPYGELLVAGKEMSIEDRTKAIREAKSLGLKGLQKDKYVNSRRLKENEQGIDNIVKKYKDDPYGFLQDLDKEQDRYYNSYIANNPSEINKDTRKEFFDDYTGLARFASQDYIPSNDITPIAQPAPVAEVPTTRQAAIAQTPVTRAPITQQQLGNIDSEDIVIENKNVKRQPPINPSRFLPSDFAGENNYVPEEQDINNQFAIPDYYPISQTPSSGFIDPRNAGWDGTDDYQYKGPTKNSTQDGGMSWENIARTAYASAYPFLRQKVSNPLDPSQLAPEMLAMSMNQEEPVGVQSYSPMLSQATRYSFQDQLNEITKQTRAAERMNPYNPEAQSMIAAGAYDARNKVLGEQFRVNQGEQARVAEQNRGTLNEAQRFNIGQFDQQMARASQAKSNTKQQKIEIAKSIAQKIQENKQETRQANLMQNMYPGFNFTGSGVAYKDPTYMASLNMSGQGASTKEGELEPGKAFSYNKARRIIGTHSVGKDDSSNGRNGALVKAIKNL